MGGYGWSFGRFGTRQRLNKSPISQDNHDEHHHFFIHFQWCNLKYPCWFTMIVPLNVRPAGRNIALDGKKDMSRKSVLLDPSLVFQQDVGIANIRRRGATNILATSANLLTSLDNNPCSIQLAYSTLQFHRVMYRPKLQVEHVVSPWVEIGCEASPASQRQIVSTLAKIGVSK